MEYYIAFFITMVMLVLVDMIWLGTVGLISLKMLEKIQGSAVTMRFWAAAIVYVALAYLVLEAKTIYQAAGIGAASYAVYDFTNLATLEKYDWRLAIADTVWGGVLFSIVWKIMNIVTKSL
jgi:uncharacterized membrane protein